MTLDIPLTIYPTSKICSNTNIAAKNSLLVRLLEVILMLIFQFFYKLGKV